MIWRVTVRLFYIEDAWSLKVKIPVRLLKITDWGVDCPKTTYCFTPSVVHRTILRPNRNVL
jgi:hypothetical protein